MNLLGIMLILAKHAMKDVLVVTSNNFEVHMHFVMASPITYLLERKDLMNIKTSTRTYASCQAFLLIK